MAERERKLTWRAIAPRLGGRRAPVSAQIDERCAKTGGYYLGQEHGLIHRHLETVALNSDETAAWQLQVDFQLPTDPAARCGRQGDEWLFLFPLMFLRKSEGRTSFYARDENGISLPLPTRARCDWVSALAATEAAKRLLPRSRRSFPLENLKPVYESTFSAKPYDASVILNQLLHGLDPLILEGWDEHGLTEDLRALVEHSMVWLPIRGLPGEQRLIEVGHEIDLARRSIVRWSFGEVQPPRFPRLRPRRARMVDDPSSVLETGKAKYGRRAYRISFPALGERIVRPLAWVPIQCEFPTIYTRRCDSYHFEVTCPSGLSPRDIRVTTGDGDEKPTGGRKTMRARSAHLYLPGGRVVGDLTVRVTAGVGAGAFPILWFFAGALTAAMLWAFAATDPKLFEGSPEGAGRNEIAAGILLLVPAVLGALVVAEEGGVARMIWGARIMLFVPALCSVGAASVLIGVAPFGFGSRSTWSACAAVATAATVPLATSWLISSPLVLHQLKKLNTPRAQYIVLGILLLLSLSLVGFLKLIGEHSALRALAAVGLLVTAVAMLLLATNRAEMKITENRRYMSLSASLAALVCLALGCIELRAAFDSEAKVHEVAEWIALPLLFVAPLAGLGLSLMTTPFKRKPDEIHIAPEDGRTVLAKESIRELRELREMTRQAISPTASEDRAIVSGNEA